MARAPRPAQPDSIEREYARLILRYQKEYRRLVSAGLKEVLPALRQEVSQQTPQALAEKPRADAYDVSAPDSGNVVSRMDADAPKAISDLFEAILGKLEKAFPDTLLRRWAAGMAMRTNKLAAKNQAKHVRRATERAKDGPVEITGILTAERKLSPYFKNVVDENVSLIRSIPKAKIEPFKSALVNAITQDMNVRDIAKIIAKNFSATEFKARVIARDQVGKLNGALDEYHQRQIGVKKYKWITMHDGAVRKDHKLLDQTIQRWDKPPIVNRRTGKRAHPKGDIQCRCYAEAVLDDVLDE